MTSSMRRLCLLVLVNILYLSKEVNSRAGKGFRRIRGFDAHELNFPVEKNVQSRGKDKKNTLGGDDGISGEAVWDVDDDFDDGVEGGGGIGEEGDDGITADGDGNGGVDGAGDGGVDGVDTGGDEGGIGSDYEDVGDNGTGDILGASDVGGIDASDGSDPPGPPDSPPFPPALSPVQPPAMDPTLPTAEIVEASENGGFGGAEIIESQDIPSGFYYQNLDPFTIEVRGEEVKNDLGVVLFLSLEMQQELENLMTVEIISFNISRSSGSRRQRSLQDWISTGAGSLFYLDFICFAEFNGLPIHSKEAVMDIQRKVLGKSDVLQAFWDVNPGIDSVVLVKTSVGSTDKINRISAGNPEDNGDSDGNIWVLVSATLGPVLFIVICLMLCYGFHRGPRLTSRQKYDLKYTIGKHDPYTREETSSDVMDRSTSLHMDRSASLHMDRSSNLHMDRSSNLHMDRSSNLHMDRSSNLHMDQSADLDQEEANDREVSSYGGRVLPETAMKDIPQEGSPSREQTNSEIYMNEFGALSPPAVGKLTPTDDSSVEVESVDMTVVSEARSLSTFPLLGEPTKYIPKATPLLREKDETSSTDSFHTCNSGGLSDNVLL